MKNLLILLVTLVAFSCSKRDVKPVQQKMFGAIGNPNMEYAARKGRGKPVKDTIVVTPPPVVDTIPTVDPMPVLPASYEIQMPTPLNQGAEGSCVSFSVCYAREREYYNKVGAWVLLSEEYLFDNTTPNHTSCSGSGIINALDFLKSTGVCTFASLPYSYTNGCSADTTGLNKEAAQFKITGYLQIASIDSVGIKAALVSNHPLVIQVPADQQFCDAGVGFVWTSLGTIVGYHTLTVCGYDDAKRAYKVINQWGTAWADGGFAWISYDLFQKISSNPLKIIL